MDKSAKGTTMELPELEDLTGFDRCDKCGSQGYVRVQLYSKSELIFCGHHYSLLEEALDSTTLRIRDERSRLGGNLVSV